MNLLHFIGFIVAAASSTVFAFQGIDIDKPRHTLEVRELCGTQDVLDRNYEAGARASHFASHDAGHHQLEYYQHGEHNYFQQKVPANQLRLISAIVACLDTREVVDLELREIVDELLRRAEAAIIRRNVVTKRGTLRGGFLKKKMFRKRTPINISWRPNAVKDLNDPLSATWKPGEDAKKKHEDIIKDHAKNVPGAVTAKIIRGAHPKGNNPNEKDHITLEYIDQNGKTIKDPAGHRLHHVYTGREKDVDVEGLWKNKHEKPVDNQKPEKADKGSKQHGEASGKKPEAEHAQKKT